MSNICLMYRHPSNKMNLDTHRPKVHLRCASESMFKTMTTKLLNGPYHYFITEESTSRERPYK